jgi:hypothetical protein
VESKALPRRLVLGGAVGVSVFLFLIYYATLIPTVVDQDSGELVAAVHVLGVAHPTGYPLWVLLGRLFDFLPVGGTSAYRVALLSAVSAAAAAGIVTALSAVLVGRIGPALIAGLGFGLWFPTWSQAVRAEVYGLTAFLTALTLVALLRWEEERSWRWAWWLALGVGFVAMHHRTAMLMVAPALVVAGVVTRPRRFRDYVVAAGLFLAPFAFYAYLPVRAMAKPALNWTDPSTLQRFFDHVLGTQYTHFAFSHNLVQMLEQAKKLTPEMLAASLALGVTLSLVGLPLIAFGAGLWIRKQPVVGWSLAAGSLILVVWVLQWGETSDLKVFFLPLGEVIALCGAIGLGKVGEALADRRVAVGVTGAVGVFICTTLLGANWERSDASNAWEHRDRWVAALSQMEPNAIFVSDFDVPSFATLYLQNVEGLRCDVTLLRTVRMSDQWYVDLLQDRELREAAAEAWAAAATTDDRVLEIHDRTAVFAYLLARRLGRGRPVYGLHPTLSVRLVGPPYFVGLSEDLVAVEFDLPSMAAAGPVGPALAEFAGGAKLLGLAWDRTEVATGEMVGFRARWQVEDAPPPRQFGIGLTPQGMPAEQFARVAKKGRFVQGFPMLYGLGSSVALSPGMYEQRGEAIMPSNAAAGEYRVAVGVGPMYAAAYQGWTEVGKIRIAARPRPRNGP